jgi:hypothetical protein
LRIRLLRSSAAVCGGLIFFGVPGELILWQVLNAM